MSEMWSPKGVRGAQFFCVVRDALLLRMEKSVRQHETRPERIRGCLEGIDLCRKLETLADFKSEIRAREPEQGHLKKLVVTTNGRFYVKGAYDYWIFCSASTQLEWAYEVLRTGFDVVQPESVNLRALAVLRSVFQDVEKGA